MYDCTGFNNWLVTVKIFFYCNTIYIYIQLFFSTFRRDFPSTLTFFTGCFLKSNNCTTRQHSTLRSLMEKWPRLRSSLSGRLESAKVTGSIPGGELWLSDDAG